MAKKEANELTEENFQDVIEAENEKADENEVKEKINKNCWHYFKSFINWLGHDLFFIIFFGIQESNDTSYLHTLTMKTRFTTKTLCLAIIGAHLVSNLVVILFTWIFAGLINHKSCKLFGVVVIYFIIAYELLFECLKFFAVLVDLNQNNVM